MQQFVGLDMATRSARSREALLFTSGVLDRVPAAIDHAIVAAERDGRAWWVVMKDVSDSLLADDRRLSRAESLSVLAAANRMWEEFWGEEVPAPVFAHGLRPHLLTRHRRVRADRA